MDPIATFGAVGFLGALGLAGLLLYAILRSRYKKAGPDEALIVYGRRKLLGKKVVSQKKYYPGYILLQMNMSDNAWHLVKNTPKVTGFVGPERRPTSISQAEVDDIVKRITSSADKPKPKFMYEKGETVRIIDGPFSSFTGVVDEVSHVRNTLKVMVTIFGRATPVELDFLQVEKS